MHKKSIYKLVAVCTALLMAGTFMFCDLGLGITPLTKFFVVFFGVIIGLQCIPAVLLFVGMVKGVFLSTETTANQVISWPETEKRS